MIEATGAEIVIKLLEIHGITTVAGIPGASILPIYHELHKSSINHVLVRHEQAAGFIAEGIARSSEKVGVCLATSGPGVMNLLTSLADAKADSIPLVAITGQVASQFVGTDAFQEADTFGLSVPITKHSILIKSPKELLEAIPKAFAIASSGRPGTVLIDIPVDIQKQKITFEEWPSPISMEHRYSRFRTIGKELAENLKIFYETLLSAKNPVIFVGGGCNSEKSASALKEFLSLMPVSCVSSLMGLGAVPWNYKGFAGMTGIFGHSFANQTVKNADVILALGVRFDERSFGFGENLNPNVKILHVDIDAAEINKLQNSYCGIVADTESVLSALNQYIKEKKPQIDINLESPVNLYKLEKNLNQNEETPENLIQSFYQIAKSAALTDEKIIITTDVGQHQMWVARGFPFSRPRQLLSSGSLGTMGFGLPSAIGAALENPDKKVICFTGDSSILMNIQELATLSELNLNITIIVLDNKALGMVYKMQDNFYKKCHSQSVYKKPTDIAKVAEAFGIESRHFDYKKILNLAQNQESSEIGDFIFGQQKPVLIQCEIPKSW